MTLPAGMAISPSAAGGRAACTPEEIGLSNANVPSCPDASKVGSAKILTPMLEDPLEGSIYLAQQGNAGPAQGANPFGSLLALYLVAEGDGMLDQARREGHSRPADRPVDGHVRRQPAAPVQRAEAELLRRATGAARDPGRLRRLRSEERADAVERRARRDGVLDPRDRLGTERRRVPERTASARRSRRARRTTRRARSARSR